MSFDQDPGESAKISASDFAQMCDEMKVIKEQRDELLSAAQEGLAAGKALMKALINIMSEMEPAAFVSAEMWLEQCGVKPGFGKRIMDTIDKATGKEDS